MTWKLYGLVSGGGALAAYALSLSPVLTPSPAGPAPSARTPVTAPSERIDIQVLADGLQVRLGDLPEYQAPSRNAFRFAGTPAVRAEAADAAAPVGRDAPTAEAGPLAPPFGLFGVMGGMGEGQPGRTAMLSSLGGVVFAREGDTVGGMWRVVAISGTAVTLESLADGAQTTTLRLFGAETP